MSSRDKVELLDYARERGYRTYVYFVGTEDPEINVGRVQQRVREKGHPVPEDKIRDRYWRSLDNLLNAMQKADRAFVFDNSGKEAVLLAYTNVDSSNPSNKSLVTTGPSVSSWFYDKVLFKSGKISKGD